MNTKITSIIYLTYNQLEHATKPCIESLYKYTDINRFELILVDNNSSDGTQEYLQEIHKKYSNTKLILSPENTGYAQGNNLGLEQATGDYIVLLNNDTLLTPGWLEIFTKILENNKNIGLLGSVTNNVGNEQKVQIPDLTENNYIEKSQEYINKFSSDSLTITDRLGFFCVAMRREVFETVGYLDREYQIGGYEDDDYCQRVISAGYQCAFTDSCFILHKGSVTLKSIDSKKMKKALRHNSARFMSKHNKYWTTSDMALGYLTKFQEEIEALPECPQKYSLLYRTKGFGYVLEEIKKREIRVLKKQNILQTIKSFFRK